MKMALLSGKNGDRLGMQMQFCHIIWVGFNAVWMGLMRLEFLYSEVV